MPEFYIGLMSGTSLDGVDGVLADFSGPRARVAGHQWRPFAPDLRAQLLALNTPGVNELHHAALAANALARTCAQVVADLLQAQGLDSAEVLALGVHGQTVRHRPGEFDGTGYTLQLNNPSLLARLTGIDVVADFRSADVAAGGQGAPLVPVFHQALLAQPQADVCVLNLGGMANITVLHANGGVTGFDCGPGNALLDSWCQQHTGQSYDAGGQWARAGQVDAALLEALLDEPFLRAAAPKSTGRDLFNPAWLMHKLAGFPHLATVDVQASLAEFTASVAARSALQTSPGCRVLRVCGGGALNTHVMARLAALLPGWDVRNTAANGIDPLHMEALAFAWLARKMLRREKLSLQSITGAQGARVLGCFYPA